MELQEKEVQKDYRPLNSRGFTMYHMVLLPLSWSHGRFCIYHGFTIFKWVFSHTHSFLRKQKKSTQSLVKKIL